MNEELIKQCVADAINPDDYPEKGGYRTAQDDAALAVRLYHARAVAPLVEAAMEARRIAMEQTVAARVPECGKFGDIAQDLDAALSAFGDAPAPEPPLAPEVRALVEAASLADQIEKLMPSLTKGDLTTAEEHEQGASYECPLCAGEGEVGGETFTNFDGLALGVQFFGIGDTHAAHQQLWYTVASNLPLIVSALRALAPAAPEPSEAEVERVREAVKRALAEIGFMDPEWRGSDADADRVARAALAAMRPEPEPTEAEVEWVLQAAIMAMPLAPRWHELSADERGAVLNAALAAMGRV